MLRGIPNKNKDEEKEETEEPTAPFSRVEEIQEQALKRFIEASSRQKTGKSPEDSEIKMKASREPIDQSNPLSFRKIFKKNDLLPISYLQSGIKVSESVCRIVLRDSTGREIGTGTGFLVSPEVLITNNHVLPDINSATNAVAEFNYQKDESSNDCPVYRFSLNPLRFFMTDRKLDFTLVSVNPTSHTDEDLKNIPWIKLISQRGKIKEEDNVSIIQHPDGLMKHVTVRENQVIFMLKDFIHYTTDTKRGSSGSPVFNDQWQVVAVHHSGVPDPDNSRNWIANEGTRVSSIAAFVKSEYQKVDKKTQEIMEGVFMELKDSINKKEDKEEDKSDPIKNAEEEKKYKPLADQYRHGYDPLFLGEDYRIDLPKLSEAMEEDSTKMKNGSNILNYVHFSVVMRQSRGLAYFTAVNIDGNQTYGETIPRKDKWSFDSRIPRSHQYGNEVYVNNDFDRGHLVRRLDPVWGEAEIARQADADTFYFTNCAPQHKKLNQKTWLRLEEYILNNADTHNLQISVFTGPVFDDSEDHQYREDYQIPNEFWKVVVMVRTDGELSVTAYVQSQKDYTKELIEREAKEAFFYDRFETYQVSLKSVEQMTGLDFGELRKYDRFGRSEATGILISELENIRL